MNHDWESTLKGKGFIQQPDGSWSKPGRAGSEPVRSSPQLQKPEAGNSGQKKRQADARSRDKDKGQNEPVAGRYFVRVSIGVPDNRVRDADGMLASILDSFQHARVRFLAMYPARRSAGISHGKANVDHHD